MTRAPLPTEGVLVPLVTPMRPDHRPDLDSLRSLIDFVLGQGAVGVLVLGSSGECVALPAADRTAVATAAVEATRGRAHTMLGVPTLGSLDARDEAARLADLGADSLLVAAPAGMRLSSGELERHFTTVAEVGTPVVAYDVPARVAVGLEPSSVAALARAGVVAGLKDSTGELPKATRYAAALRDVDGVVSYTGCEECIDASLLAGYSGSIPGLANVFPQFHVALARAATAGDWSGAAARQAEIGRLLDLYFQPVPGGSFLAQFFGGVKAALVELGVIAHDTTSSVLTPVDDALRAHAARLVALGRELEPAARR